MKKKLLHILIFYGFLINITAIYAQQNQNQNSIEKTWENLQWELEKGNVEKVKSAFNEFASVAIQYKEDSILIKGITTVGSFYKQKEEIAERIKWYQYAVDSICNEGLGCINVKRDFASIYHSIGEYDKAIELLKSSLGFIRKNNHSRIETINYTLIAKNYFEKKDLEKAEEYFLKASNSSFIKKDTVFIILAYNNLGLFYKDIEQYEKSNEIFLKGIHVLEGCDQLDEYQALQLVLLKGNMGGNMIRMKANIKEGVDYLNEDITYNLKYGEPHLGVNATITLAGFYFERNQLDDAISILDKCHSSLKNKIENKELQLSLIQLYYWSFKVNLEQKNTEEAIRFFEKYNTLKIQNDQALEDRRFLIRKSLLNNIFNVQLEFQKQQVKLKEKENEVLTQKSKYVFYQILIGILSFFILVIVIIFYSKKRISQMRTKKDLAEKRLKIEKLEKQKAKLELNYKNKDLTDFAIDISRKQEVLTEVKSKLNEIISDSSANATTKKTVRSLIQYANNNLLVDEQLKSFQENVEEVNYKFLDQLQKRYPDLTELDKNICGLIRLGLSNKEIAGMRNVSYKAIRMSRYRLRKKLGLSEEVNIVEFLKSIE